MDGPHLFAGGRLAHARTGFLSLNVCSDGAMPLGQWQEYLEAMQGLSQANRRDLSLGLFWFMENPPNAAMRKASADFVTKNRIKDMARIAVLTDSLAGRGAVTAMSWFLKKSALKAFAPDKIDDALSWLREGGEFELDAAREAFDALVRAVRLAA